MTTREKANGWKYSVPTKSTSCFTCVVWSRHSCQSHDLLASKLNAYGLETSAVHLIFDYLTNRKQQIKIDCHYSSRRCSPGCCKCLRWLTIVATLSILDIYGGGRGSWLRLLLMDKTPFRSSARISGICCLASILVIYFFWQEICKW